jgi:hypothetical protein
MLDAHFFNPIDRVQRSVIAFSWVGDPTPSLSIRATMVATNAAQFLSVSLTHQSSRHSSELTTQMRALERNAGTKS